VRIGVSTLLIRDNLGDTFRQAITTALIALAVALLVSLLLTQWILRKWSLPQIWELKTREFSPRPDSIFLKSGEGGFRPSLHLIL
jgi:multidrug efflux pump subunit AcrB